MRKEVASGQFNAQVRYPAGPILTVGISSSLRDALQAMTRRPRLLHKTEIGNPHQTLNRPIRRKDEGEVRQAEDPFLWRLRHPLLLADELHDVGKVSSRGSLKVGKASVVTKGLWRETTRRLTR